MPEIRNCPRCGRIFTSIGRPICNKCMEAEEKEFKQVKEYIYDNPGANISEVSQETGVSAEKIMRFLREERLELISENNNLLLECERCGKPINSGRFCENCKVDIDRGFRREFGIEARGSERRSLPKTEKDRMFTATRRRNN